jgi:integrase/recombinase XerD
MTRMRQYLPHAEWPEEDRRLWDTAFKKGERLFDDCGRGAHLSERSRQQLQYAYGKFLKFVAVRHPGRLGCDPIARVSADMIKQFVKFQPKTCGDVTISIYLYHLSLALKSMYPACDWSWLMTISERFAARGKGKRKKYNLVTSETLYALGIALMDNALSKGKPITASSVQTTYRDGLIIAFLALVPLRRRTLGLLRIGEQLVRSGDGWAIDIPASDMKSGRPFELPLSPELSPRMGFYVKKIRPQILGAEGNHYLWANRCGPMSDRMIYANVRRRTQNALGFPVNLHRFRHAAATFWSVRDQVNVRGVKDLLGHATFATTEEHYIMAQSRLAGRVLAQAIEELEEGSEGSLLGKQNDGTRSD